MKKSILALLGFVCLVDLALAQQATTTVICKRTSSGAITLRVKKCKSNETKLSNISSLTGATGQDGQNGEDGADGSIRIYGDGSAGALHVTSSTSLDEANLQYSSISIDSGSTLTVPSGTILRCTGTFTNNGSISVSGHARGGLLAAVTTSTLTSPYSPPITGISQRAAGAGEQGENTISLYGGTGGLTSMTSAQAKVILSPGVLGGGGGAGPSGGWGGGTLTVLCKGTVSNNGTISAAGTTAGNGGGGGAGGIVILASQESVTNSAAGTISVVGGNGGSSTTTFGGGGGGGGGIVHLISTTAPVNSGTITVSGGTAGSNTTSVTFNPRTGGGGGGSCAGAGGSGSGINTSNVSSGNDDGESGQSILTTADPTSLF